MTAIAPAGAGDRRRAVGLDVARGLAAFGVLVTHVAFVTGVVNPDRWSSPLRDVLPRLDVGVWVFFVLSGLLVSRPFVRAYLAGTAHPEPGPYLLRRAVRIFPLYWAVLIATLLLDGRPLPGAAELAADALLVHIYRPEWAIGPITQSWTLATEIGFYVFVPVWFAWLAGATARRGVGDPAGRWRWALWGLAGWVVVSFVWRAGVVALTDTFDYTQPGTDVRGALLSWTPNFLDVFAVGVGLALWLERGRVPVVRPGARLASYLVGLVALGVASLALDLPPLFTGFDGGQTFARHALFLVVAAAAVTPSALATAHPGRVPSAFARAALWTAFATYGVYLWHQLVTDRWFEQRDLAEFAAPFPTTLVVVTVVSSALALVTYFVVERPTGRAAVAWLARVRGERPPPRRLGRHPALDGLRGLSILAVLGTHIVFLDDGRSTWALDGGFLGVDVFLVLSGFLIGATLLREVDRTGQVSMPAFLRRRARRLLPALVGFLAVYLAVSALLGDPMGEPLFQALLALLFISNWQLSFGHQPPFDLVHLWSLSVEGQMYVVLAVVVGRARRAVLDRPWSMVAGLVAASAAVAWWRYAQYRAGVDPVALYERTDTRADSMLLGLAAAVVWQSRLVPGAAIRRAGVVGGAVLLVCVLAAEPEADWLFTGGFTLVSLAAAALVAGAALPAGPTVTVGTWWPLRWFGRISYSLYLWHLPIYLWTVRALPDAPLGVVAPVAICASLVAAEASFRLLEARVVAPWRRGGAQGSEQTESATPTGARSR